MSDNIEVRDEIARMMGWSETGSVWSNHIAETDVLFPGSRYGDHPIPNTLDEAAKLPEGWDEVSIWHDYKDAPWCAKAKNGMAVFEIGRAPTELEARFALRLAVLKHMASLAAKETK